MHSPLSRIKDRILAIFPRRRPDQFITRLTQQSDILVQGGEALVIYMKKPSNKNAQAVRAIEKEADEIRRILIDELNRSFVTPIDREDIFTLSRALDDVLDYMYSVVNEMDILDVNPTEHLQEMAEMLHDASQELHMAMQRLEHHPGVAEDHAIRAKQIDNRMETLYATALAELFRGPKDLEHVVEMLKLREIYRHMLHAVGSSDTAANIISDIVVKFF
jgi:predicted phosphate transport protein (TIGR00153 family)